MINVELPSLPRFANIGLLYIFSPTVSKLMELHGEGRSATGTGVQRGGGGGYEPPIQDSV